ncbi:hypothetical protein KBP46_13700 [Chryseobacterium sp. PCH239]|uniref:hypothetical protein n=1 Tax=Chryseobacterium sp. PCH239 TaxID=2825845 RepID=UPI001C0F7B1B|nr:hypothetical protein [Chryseobacterium sp. PCH239]QWT84560.1 hypothetical protein KBP46_13700 [Chryseobacterium sp. PCH239]
MIFLSAQPDDIYFIWQLELLIRNLNELGVANNNIHLIIGYHPIVGLKKEFQQFIEKYHDQAHFFIYPDTRSEQKYTSSIRPHLLSKHWKAFPYLNDQVIFYHDSDILFGRIPLIDSVAANQINYVSDTRSYLDSHYIINFSTIAILEKMCAIVGISKEVVLKNDINAGGAQYILKKIPSKFWNKVYSDSEAIFSLLEDFNNTEQQKVLNDPYYTPKKIQSWCTDMWAVLWNLWVLEKEVKIHSELDFCWPTDPIELYQKKAILHYSGSQTEKDQYFYKRDYFHHAPWYDDHLTTIPSNNCSYPIVQHIQNIKSDLDYERIKLIDWVFIIENNTHQLKAFPDIIKKYLLKYFDTEIIKGISTYDHKKRVIRVPDHILIPIHSVMKIINTSYSIYQFSHYYQVDQLFSTVFTKVLDSELLVQNAGKFSISNQLSIIYKAQPAGDLTADQVFQLNDPIFSLV